MPTGPFGFPRLTSLGPLVEQSEIHPAIDLSSGVYPYKALVQEEQRTADDTMQVITDEADFKGVNIHKGDVEFRYHEMQIADLINGNSFSKNLLNMMHSFQDAYGEGVFVLHGNDLVIPEVEEQIYNLAKGERSVLNEDQLLNVAGSYAMYKDTGDQRDLNEVVEKVSSDFNRVHRINESVRSTNEYWPPSVEQNADEDSGIGFGTIDGNHRVVALSQVLGTDKKIYVWEWINEKELLQ